MPRFTMTVDAHDSARHPALEAREDIARLVRAHPAVTAASVSPLHVGQLSALGADFEPREWMTFARALDLAIAAGRALADLVPAGAGLDDTDTADLEALRERALRNAGELAGAEHPDAYLRCSTCGWVYPLTNMPDDERCGEPIAGARGPETCNGELKVAIQ